MRKVFPTEKVMEMVTAKKGCDVSDVASHTLGCPVEGKEATETAAPFASAWLARWQPKFMDLDWEEKESWENFLKRAKARLGEHVSIEPMEGRIKDLAHKALHGLKDLKNDLLRQTDAAAKLEERIRKLEPAEAVAKALQKKNDELEAKLKAMKAELGTLQRKVNEFQGKLPVDQNELLQTIKDGIKDGLKGMVVAGAAAGAASGAQAVEESKEEAGGVPDDFGFGTSSPDSDGFGF